MNLCHLYKKLDPTESVYLQLLTDVELDDDGNLYSLLDVDDFDDYPGAIKELISSGLIYMEDGYAVVGKRIGNTNKLLEATGLDYDAVFKPLISWAKEYSDLSARGRAVKRKLLDHIEEMHKGSVKEMLSFFDTAFEISLQTSCPSFMEKEAGQIKNLLKRYDKATLMAIVTYMFTKEKGSTINVLTYRANDFYAELTKKNKTRSHTSTSNDF